MQEQEVVIVNIKDQDGRFLSLKRSKGEDDGIIWGFPSGKVERDESQEAAVIREVQEETGILCKPIESVGTGVRSNYKLIYWTAEFIHGNPRDPETSETSEVAFRSVKEIIKLIPVSFMHPCVRQQLGIQDTAISPAPSLGQ